MSIFTRLKDKTTSFIGEKVLKSKIKRYGTMLDFKIDSENKRIFLSVLLKGEQQPLQVSVNKYSFAKEGDDTFIVIDSLSINREWMNLLAIDLLKEKKFKLPHGIATTAAKIVL